MKRLVLLSLVLLSGCACLWAADPRGEYVARWSSVAQSEMTRTGVPASITLAQGILESSCGRSLLATAANNHFGIKCHGWKGNQMYKEAEIGKECFRSYEKAEDSFRDHSDFLCSRDRYKTLFDLDPTDYKAWAKGLRQAGYATDPLYSDKLVKIIEENELYRFDAKKQNEPSLALEPATPLDTEGTEEYEIPLAREVYKIDGVPCVYAMEGETYESIALLYKLFHKELLRFNGLKEDEPLHGGQIVYLSAPKK